MTDANDIRTSQSSVSPHPRKLAASEPWEDAIRQAFDGMHASHELQQATLAAIEAQRSSLPAGGEGRADRRVSPKAASCPMRKRRFRAFRRVVAAAACLLAVAAGVMGYRLYLTPAAYVGVDVNPSLELAVNAVGMVIDAQPLNQDAEAVLQSISLKNQSYEEALGALLASEALASYLVDGAYVEVSVTTDDDALADRLQNDSDVCLDASPCEGSCHRVDSETRESAHHTGMGVGKYEMAKKLAELDPTVNVEDCGQMSMKELRDRIDACLDSGSCEEVSGQQKGSGSQDAGEGAGGTHHREGDGVGYAVAHSGAKGQ